MNTYALTLRVLAVSIFCISVVHVALGVSAETLLGAMVSEASLLDPSLDSQNRFYGAAFSLFGLILWWCSADPARDRSLLLATYLVFFLAGCSRFVSIWMLGLPSAAVLALLIIELILPVVMGVWLQRAAGKAN